MYIILENNNLLSLLRSEFVVHVNNMLIIIIVLIKHEHSH